jgi:E3 ubiquitin-protein ligase UBR1
MNRQVRTKLGADGSEIICQRQGLGRGFPQKNTTRGPVAVSCSHMVVLTIIMSLLGGGIVSK